MCNIQVNAQQELLLKFFDEMVDPSSMAKHLRRATYLIAQSYIRSAENTNPMRQEWADDSFYFLNELAEVLEPVLEKK
ncbi:hypothetical protein ACFX5E_11600 [Flavobacterium sp. LS2P90]|uniref:Uncharacterized protein n=1 Tax=Flavobacterium xylosi TaxID=3230415 RepID=A0ABW6HYR6_9FLAO